MYKPNASPHVVQISAHIIPVLVFVVILLFLFADVFLHGLFWESDFETYYMPIRHLVFGNIGSEFPFWNPYQATGTPLLGNFQSAAFYPLNIIFLFFDIKNAFVLSAFLHLLLSSIFMYVFIFQLTNNKSCSMISGITYMLSSFIILRFVGHVTITCTYPWLIFCLYCFHNAVLNNSLKWTYLTGIGFALQFLGGHPPTSYYTGLALGFYALALGIVSKKIKKTLQNVLYLTIACIVSIFLSAIQLVPSFIYSLSSSRAEGTSSFKFSMSYSYPLENMITWISPLFYGNEPHGFYWGRWHQHEVIFYIGLVSLILFLVSWRLKNIDSRLFSVFAVISFLFALGKYTPLGLFLYNYFPGISHLRAPGRFVMLTGLSISIISGLSIHAMIVNNNTAKNICLNSLKCCIVIFGIVFFLITIIKINDGLGPYRWSRFVYNILTVEEHIREMTRSEDILRQINSKTSASLWDTAWILFLATAVFLYGYKYGADRIFVYACIILISFDLLSFGKQFIKVKNPFPIGFEESLLVLFSDTKIPPRITTEINVSTLSERPFLTKGTFNKIANVGGYDSNLPLRYIEYYNQMYDIPITTPQDAPVPLKPNTMFKLMGVSHVLVTRDAPPYPNATKVASTTDHDVYQLYHPFPRAFIVHNALTISDKQKLLQTLHEPDFDPLQVVLLENVPQYPSFKSTPAPRDKVVITEYSANRIVVEVENSQPGIFVLTDTYYPQWKAFLNEVEVPILAANHLFRGVALGPGTFRLEFRYSKTAFYWGLTISIVSTVLVVFLLRTRTPRSTMRS